MTSLLAVSPFDSARFAMQIVRGKVSTSLTPLLVDAIADDVIAAAADVAIVRVAAGEHGLEQVQRRGLPLLHADTLVYYKAGLARCVPAAIRNVDVVIRRGTVADAPALTALVTRVFAGYRNHYAANPLFAADDMVAGYGEWACRHLTDDNAVVFVVERDTRLVAFIACADVADGVVDIILNGVDHDEAGRGLYSDLVAHVQRDAIARGVHTLLVSTQIGNVAVQKVWTRAGFFLAEAWDTWHINALLTRVIKAPRTPLTRPVLDEIAARGASASWHRWRNGVPHSMAEVPTAVGLRLGFFDDAGLCVSADIG